MSQTNLVALFISFPNVYTFLYFSSHLGPKNGKKCQKPIFLLIFHRNLGQKYSSPILRNRGNADSVAGVGYRKGGKVKAPQALYCGIEVLLTA